MTTNEQLMTQELAKCYIDIFDTRIKHTVPSSVKEISRDHLLWMCREVFENYKDWSLAKSHRWIGYVQGVLSAYYLISVDEHRDITREIMEKYNV